MDTCSYCDSPEGHINQVLVSLSHVRVNVCQKKTCNDKWLKACRKAYHLARGETACNECDAFEE
jgi:hypothetical protein